MALNCDGRVLLGPLPITKKEFDAQVKSAMDTMEAQSASANITSPPCAECPGEQCINFPNSCFQCRYGAECYAQRAGGE
jgi:hypothetical protein